MRLIKRGDEAVSHHIGHEFPTLTFPPENADNSAQHTETAGYGTQFFANES